MNKFTFALGFLLMLTIIILIGASIFWGLGNFIIWAFKINFIWTFWHGLACQFIFLLLHQIFGGKKGD